MARALLRWYTVTYSKLYATAFKFFLSLCLLAYKIREFIMAFSAVSSMYFVFTPPTPYCFCFLFPRALTDLFHLLYRISLLSSCYICTWKIHLPHRKCIQANLFYLPQWFPGPLISLNTNSDFFRVVYNYPPPPALCVCVYIIFSSSACLLIDLNGQFHILGVMNSVVLSVEMQVSRCHTSPILQYMSRSSIAVLCGSSISISLENPYTELYVFLLLSAVNSTKCILCFCSFFFILKIDVFFFFCKFLVVNEKRPLNILCISDLTLSYWMF